jgi:hypothetical protein
MPKGEKSAWSIGDLERMLNERRSAIARLNKRWTKAQKKLDAIDREIAKLGGGSNAKGGRVKNSQSLVSTLETVLKGKASMSVGDIVDAVQARGYRSNSANFRGIVNQTLIKEPQFTSVGRGMYHLKK